jgi:hypothetical protein
MQDRARHATPAICHLSYPKRSCLRAHLQAAPPRHFNGIGYQFVVAAGRLSYAEPPDEVSGSDWMLLEQLADPAREMDLVVAGPESESVWSLFQEDEGNYNHSGDWSLSFCSCLPQTPIALKH